jgi:hypothetical protein
VNTYFNTWWREKGQFIPPCDTLSQSAREPFRQMAESAFNEGARDCENMEDKLERQKDETKFYLHIAEDLKADIRLILCSEKSPSEKIDAISRRL